jgi:hypothetical protein
MPHLTVGHSPYPVAPTSSTPLASENSMHRLWILTSVLLSAILVVPRAAGGAEGTEAGKAGQVSKASVYRPAAQPAPIDPSPIRLHAGPHLFVDDYLIDQTTRVERRVNCPTRDPKLPNPIVTGKEDFNFQPYMSVIRDPQTGRFRIWYGAGTADRRLAGSHLATMESTDGIHWIRPPRVLKDPAPIQFGCSVLDEGPNFSDPSARYRFAWWAPEGGHGGGGLKIAVSPDGLNFTPMTPHVVLRHNHDINNLFYDTLRRRYVATLSVWGVGGPTWKGGRRATMQSTSQDLVHWSEPWYVLTPDDRSDPPGTDFYAINGYLIRGDLWIGLVKVLHDNWRAPGTPTGSFGVGVTHLAWSRDGEHWIRDQAPFFEPDPKPGAWDHAHAWIDCQLPVGEEVYLYYAGYKNGHKVNRFEERQIGLLRMPRDRYVSRDADAQGGTLLTRPLILDGSAITLNARVRGELKARLLDAFGRPLPGFDLPDCQPIHGDAVALPLRWTGVLSGIKEKPVRIEFQLRDAQLYGFDLVR